MDSIRRMQRFIILFFVLMLLIPGSIFAGMGVVTILHWSGFSQIPNVAAIFLGPIAVFILYVIPQLVSYFAARLEIKKYFPVTNDNIRNYREFYMGHIEQEIQYLEQAAQAFQARGMRDDYNVFWEGLKTFQEIKSLVQNNQDLQRKHLVCLNQVFNKKYLLKKLQH